jgi:anaerobic magnesium-protoporphyrin IX monomethyl ester cyclase
MTDMAFIDPPVSTEIRFGKLAKAGSFLPSLGLAGLAAMAEEDGFKVKIIDANIENLDLNSLVERVLKEKPKWVGISATTLTINTAGKLAARLKEEDRELKVIVGGAHITALPKLTLREYPAIDVGVIGEGELTLRELLNRWQKGKNLVGVKGLIYREKGKLTVTERRPFIQNLDSLPMPAWERLTGFPEAYRLSLNSYLKLPAVHLVTSRGCTGQCLFCDRSVFGRQPRMYSAGRVMEMIDLLREKYGIKEIQFFDDNFALFPSRLKLICQGLSRRGMSWSCQVRADMVNPGMLKLMKKSGCWQVGIGIESGSDEVLRILKKQETRQVLETHIKQIARAGLEVKGFFILGNPGESRETLKETEEFALSLPLTYAHTTYFTPYPGCEAYNTILQFGKFKKSHDWTRLGRGTIEPIFWPYGLEKEDLMLAARRIFRRFYFRPRIIIYHLKKCLKSPKLLSGYFQGLASVLNFVK